MIIDAKCTNCKHVDTGSFLFNSFCRKYKMNILYKNKVCRFWQPPLKTMDIWMERSKEKPPTTHNSSYETTQSKIAPSKSAKADFS